MSRKRFQDDRGFVVGRKLKKGPNGRNLCRRCGIEVSGRRITFCSDECVHQHKLRTSAQYVRQCVFARDHGVCATCDLDTEKLSRLLLSIWLQTPESAHQNAWIHGFGNVFRDVSNTWRGYKTRSLWQADHIVPVVEGGGECGIDNFRTLCLPCHQIVTAELAGRTARRKKSAT